jgi:glycosyltransferase involved in cell wall biosynthesis
LFSHGRAPSVLIIVQNLPVPLDRRVWLECRALVQAGYDVAVICPQGPGDPEFEELEGVALYKYPPPPEMSGAVGYVREFVYCWLKAARLSLKVWRRRRFQVIQACNPPDTYWALAALWKVFGVKFVYDQHDLNPELFRAKFGQPRRLVHRFQHRMLVWLERRTYRQADHVVATNESYRLIALTRGERAMGDVTVVRSGPNTSQMRPVAPLPALRSGADFLVCYLGIMGSQDGVDNLLRSVHCLVHEHGRRDIHFALLGFGESLEEMRELARELDLSDWVTFTGRADARMITEYLSTADLGVCPDPRTVFNDLSTMNKVMEYMAFALPVVAYELHESRMSAGDAAVYVESGDVDAFAKVIGELLDDPARRREMAVAGRRRAATELDWSAQAHAYVGVYEKLLGREHPRSLSEAWPLVDRRQPDVVVPLQNDWGHELVDLRAGGAAARGLLRAAEAELSDQPALQNLPTMRIPVDDEKPTGLLNDVDS